MEWVSPLGIVKEDIKYILILLNDKNSDTFEQNLLISLKTSQKN